MKLKSILLYSLLLALPLFSAHAQKADSLSGKTPFIQGIGVVIDYGKLFTLPFDFETKYEGGLEILFIKNILINAELGYGHLKPEGAYRNANYEVEGYYGRAGLNYLITISAKSNIIIGLRYGKSFFEDRGTYEIGSELWDHYKASFGRAELEADWGELVIGSEAKLWKGLFIGWKFRLKVLNRFENHEPIPVYAIPGYGRAFDKTVPALNLDIKYRFGF